MTRGALAVFVAGAIAMACGQRGDGAGSGAAPSASASSGALAGFVQHVSPGGFEIMMPGKVTQEEMPIETILGKVTGHMTIARDGANNEFVTSWAEFYTMGDAKTLLESARDGAIKNTASTLVSSTEIQLEDKVRDKKHPGLDITGSNPSAGKFRMRIYLVEKRLFQIFAIGGDEERARAYLDSFKLTATTPPVAPLTLPLPSAGSPSAVPSAKDP